MRLLQKGPMLQRQVEDQAGDAGFSPRMLKDVSRGDRYDKARISVGEEGGPVVMAWVWKLA